MKDVQTKALVAGVAAITIVGFSACSSHKPAAEKPMSTNPATSMAAPMIPSTAADPAADLIGKGCADYAALHPSGPASVTGMAQDPVATAASNNPLLSTLTSALSGKLNPQVNLVDTLNNGQYTVFADDAFAKLPTATIDELKTNAEMLKRILTYHVMQGQETPAKVDGSHKTLRGADVNVTGRGNDLKVNDAGLVCGGVPLYRFQAARYLIPFRAAYSDNFTHMV